MTNQLATHAPELNTVIAIAGLTLIKKQLSANDYFIYQSKIQKLGQDAADLWILSYAYMLDGKPLTMDAITLLTFEERAQLDVNLSSIDTAITLLDDASTLAESNHFMLSTGEEIRKINLSGAAYPAFKRKLSENASDAFKWAVLRMFLVNDEPITEERLNSDRPDSITFENAAVLVQRISAVFQTFRQMRT